MEIFGSDDDNSSEEKDDGDRDANGREKSCGVCTFHRHTETSVLSHVCNALTVRGAMADESVDAGRAKIQRAELLLKSIDDFCTTRHWMMHTGPEKAELIESVLKEQIDKKLASQTSSEPFVLVELGSYCGYGSIAMAKTCLVAYGDRLNLKLITLEVNPEYLAVADQLIGLSGLDEIISLHEVHFNGHETDVVEILQNQLRSSSEGSQLKQIDFLFIDHDKDLYLTDLKKLESSGLIRRGTRVVADNVCFAQINDYLDYLHNKQSDGLLKTYTIPCYVEYSGGPNNSEGLDVEELNDGIEVTDYHSDP